MKLERCVSHTISPFFKKFIKKAKNSSKLGSNKKVHMLSSQMAKPGKFIFANIKFLKTPITKTDAIGKNIKFTINDINSLSSFNFFKQEPEKQKETLQISQAKTLEKQIEEFSFDSDIEDTVSLTCVEQLPSFEDTYSSKTRNLMDLFEQTYDRKPENTTEDYLKLMKKIDSEYKISKNYFKDYLPCQLNPHMRAILVDWMFEVADDFKLKRDTVYEAVNILDRLFQTKCNIVQKKNLQGLGITTLHIAAKKEEIYPPKLKKFMDVTENQFDEKQIVDFELTILQKIKWKLHPITLNFMLNYCLHQWDQFVLDNSKKFTIFQDTPEFFMFFKQDPDSFINYRIISSYVDAAILDDEIFSLDSKILINMFLYLSMMQNFETTQKMKKGENSEDTMLMETKNKCFDEIFNDFLKINMECNIDEVFTAMNFANQFMSLQINFDMMGDNFDKTVAFDFEKNYNHNLSFQIHNKKALDFVSNLKKF